MKVKVNDVELDLEPGTSAIDAVFAAVPYCLDLIGAARIETDEGRIRAFRPA